MNFRYLGASNRYTLKNLFWRAWGFVERHYRVNNFLSALPVPPAKGAVLSRVNMPVVIIGCGRSGTTMLFSALSEHPNLLPTRGFPDGEDTDFWMRIAGARIAGLGGTTSRTPVGQCLCAPMGAQDLDPGRIEFVHRWLLNEYPALGRPGHRLLNKNPHLSNKLGYIHAIFPDVRLIHIIRHPCAMVASWMVVLNQN